MNDNAEILENFVCEDCGWPVVDSVCRNWKGNFKDSDNWDWWVYCSNKTCRNHDGEGIFQDWPEWLKEVK